jgi:hypothetical protein
MDSMREDLDMTRIGSVMALGFMLVLPLGATAGEKVEAKGEPVAAVSAAPSERPAATERSEKKERSEKRSMLRGSTHSDPGLRFNNPYAFPIQSLPLAVPNVTTFSF